MKFHYQTSEDARKGGTRLMQLNGDIDFCENWRGKKDTPAYERECGSLAEWKAEQAARRKALLSFERRNPD